MGFYYCNGSCHDGLDAINFIQTSFGQLLLFLKVHDDIPENTSSYSLIKQLWYDKMYKNNAKLFNRLEIINDNTFDVILQQIIENNKISQIVINTFYAFNNSIFIRELKKYNLTLFIKQFSNNNQFGTTSTMATCSQIIISFLLKIIKNINHIFEAKYLFYKLLNASCKGPEQYDFDNYNDNDNNDTKVIPNKY